MRRYGVGIAAGDRPDHDLAPPRIFPNQLATPMFLSVFDMFKIGIGPSSSHTMGPMVAAGRFLDEVVCGSWPRPSGVSVAGLKVRLHGSLAFTGIGHATDRAVVLGLAGHLPASVDLERMDAMVAEIRTAKAVQPAGHPGYAFDPARDLVFDRKTPLSGHPNGMAFEACDRGGRLVLRRTYFSIGGWFVVDEQELKASQQRPRPEASCHPIPFPFSTAAEMLGMSRRSGLSIAQMKRQNELMFRTGSEIDAGLDRIWQTMDACIDRGLAQTGTLPGGLGVRRRAGELRERLLRDRLSNRINPLDPYQHAAVCPPRRRVGDGDRVAQGGLRDAFAATNKSVDHHKATGNLRAVQILLGHTKIESTVRYLDVDVEDALTLAEGTEVQPSTAAVPTAGRGG